MALILPVYSVVKVKTSVLFFLRYVTVIFHFADFLDIHKFENNMTYNNRNLMLDTCENVTSSDFIVSLVTQWTFVWNVVVESYKYCIFKEQIPKLAF